MPAHIWFMYEKFIPCRKSFFRNVKKTEQKWKGDEWEKKKNSFSYASGFLLDSELPSRYAVSLPSSPFTQICRRSSWCNIFTINDFFSLNNNKLYATFYSQSFMCGEFLFTGTKAKKIIRGFRFMTCRRLPCHIFPPFWT